MHNLWIFQRYSCWVEKAHDKDAHRRKAFQVQPVQLRLHFFWSPSETHEDALWGETFPMQQMQQSFHTEKPPDKTYNNPHDLDGLNWFHLIVI